VKRERELEQDERHLPRGAPPFQDRQQLAVVPDGLIQRVLLARAIPRAREVRDRLVFVRRGEPMMREEPGDLVLAAGVPRFQPRRGAPMQRAASLRDERPVRGLLDQHVLEPVFGLRPPASLADQVEPLEFHERAPDVGVVRDGLEVRQAERTAEHGRGKQRVARAGIQPVDPRDDDFLDGRRDLDLDLVVEPPAVVLVHERAGIDQRPDDLLEEEGIALGRLEDPPLHLRRELEPADQRAEELPPAAARQRL
jgi:hypothetical protein